MKKQILLRALLGMPLGIATGQCITLLISFLWGNGAYLVAVPELIESMGSPLHAALAQTFTYGLVGAGLGVGSLIWAVPQWSLLTQSLLYFIVTAGAMFTATFSMHWIHSRPLEVFFYLGVFTVILFIVWLVIYLANRHAIRKMNAALRDQRPPE